MRRRTWLILGGVLLVTLAGWAVASRRGASATAVDIGRVATRDVFRSYVTASGEIVATRYADIGSSVMGRVVALNVAEGDRVRAGQVLARIDPVQARSESLAASEQVKVLEADEQAARQQVQSATAAVAQAEARSREAQQSLARARRLHEEGLTPQSDLDTAQAVGRRHRRAAGRRAGGPRPGRADARRRRPAHRPGQGRRHPHAGLLSKTEIAAPIDGVVSRLQVRLGEMVVIGIQNQPGTTLMTVSDLSDIDAEIKVAEADVLRLALGQRARVTLEAVPGREFGGRVVEIGASALPSVGTGAAAREFRVVVRLDAPDPGLRPGLTCDAEVLTAERKNVRTVPLQSVVLRAGADGKEQSGVFTRKNGRAVFVPVKTGIIGGLDIEVEGVANGTEVVIGPFQVLRELKDGAEIRTVGGG